ncbi:hypothetical protein ACOQFV_24745 [Nocardiopsis changdeensis]|uniref:Uncharacterized protein n=1 Tax=Nocardiopsis changdeensis TaxID=2831969 RepID=A0A975KUK5_9ACTN|nr:MULTISPECIES: hypothetical protein [Nocardiopsis]QUX26553.1 hypothetical protein KGD84_33175 [Nocardiopsis changdeensis]QYX40672.1 hypothetical protein K1J57_32245 [Nocardiopsis sp. MT53]
MSRLLTAPDGAVWAEQVLTARYPELEAQAHGIASVFAVLAVSRLAADVTLRQLGVDGVEPLTPDQARAGLVLVEDATRAPRFAELLLAHSAHALGMTWEEIAVVRRKTSGSSYRKRLDRIQAEFFIPTYELPARPVLGEYGKHAKALLQEALEGRLVNPHQNAAAADLLAALLFVRTEAGQPAQALRTWLETANLAPALEALEDLATDQARAAQDLLTAHTTGDQHFRASVESLVVLALSHLPDPEHPMSTDPRAQPPGSPALVLLSQAARTFLAWWLEEDDPDTARTIKQRGTARLDAERIDALLEELKTPDNVAGHEEAVQDLLRARGELAELDAARTDIARMREIGWEGFQREVEDAQAAAGDMYPDGFGRLCDALGLTGVYREAGLTDDPTEDDVQRRARAFGLSPTVYPR